MALYDELKALDKSIADAYLAATVKSKGSDPVKLDKAGAESIIQIASKAGDIGGAQLQCVFAVWQRADFATDGQKYFDDIIMALFFGKGVCKLKRSKAELSEIIDALSLAATAVNFTGPKIGLTYNSQQYEAIKELVSSQKILIIEADHKGALPSTIGGLYVNEVNALFLFPPVSKIDRVQTIVHELTHAIQDWNDLATKTEYMELDAFLAQALLFAKISGPVSPKSPFYKCVQMILAGDAKVNNPAWNGTTSKPGAYDAAAEIVGEDPSYKPRKGVTTKANINEFGTPEKVIMAGILKNLKKKSPTPAPKPTSPPRMNR